MQQRGSLFFVNTQTSVIFRKKNMKFRYYILSFFVKKVLKIMKDIYYIIVSFFIYFYKFALKIRLHSIDGVHFSNIFDYS